MHGRGEVRGVVGQVGPGVERGHQLGEPGGVDLLAGAHGVDHGQEEAGLCRDAQLRVRVQHEPQQRRAGPADTDTIGMGERVSMAATVAMVQGWP